MILREATLADIAEMQRIRNAVKENMLSDAGLVTDADVKDYIIRRGKGWVCEADGAITGFAIADLQDNNIWALFVHPDFEGRGIGGKLHDKMLDWYFSQSDKTVWLGTAPGTRAESFYRKRGWKEIGFHGIGEIKFEITADQWQSTTR